MLVLAYLWILALIPLLVETDDEEIQWHAKHGIILTVFWIIISVALTILTTLTGGILGCITCFYPLVVLGIHIYLMVQAVNGKKVKLPVVSDFVDQWK